MYLGSVSLKQFNSVSVSSQSLMSWLVSCLDTCVLANVSVSENCLDSITDNILPLRFSCAETITGTRSFSRLVDRHISISVTLGCAFNRPARVYRRTADRHGTAEQTDHRRMEWCWAIPTILHRGMYREIIPRYTIVPWWYFRRVASTDRPGVDPSCLTFLVLILMDASMPHRCVFFKPRLRDTIGCQIGWTTSWMLVYTMQPVVRPLWQPVLSCKRGFRRVSAWIEDLAGLRRPKGPFIWPNWTQFASFVYFSSFQSGWYECNFSLKLCTVYPCPRAVFTGRVVNTGVILNTRVHGQLVLSQAFWK